MLTHRSTNIPRSPTRSPRARASSRFISTLLGVLAIAVVAVGVSPGAQAEQNPTWVVAELSGKVQARHGNGDWYPLAKDARLNAATEIITGADGRAVLARGTSTITLAGDSHLEVPNLSQQASDDGVFQSLGTLLYKVRPKLGQRFKVKTPYLVTTIKGTVFSVTVNTLGASVHVSEGLVDVTPTQGGDGAAVGAGQTASVLAAAGADVNVEGAGTQGAPQPKSGDDADVGGGRPGGQSHSGQVIFADEDAPGQAISDHARVFSDNPIPGAARTADRSNDRSNAGNGNNLPAKAAAADLAAVPDVGTGAVDLSAGGDLPAGDDIAAGDDLAGNGSVAATGNGNAYGKGNGNAYGNSASNVSASAAVAASDAAVQKSNNGKAKGKNK